MIFEGSWLYRIFDNNEDFRFVWAGRTSDVFGCTKKLDMAAKLLKEMQAPVDVGTVDGQQLITQIVSCYINACETTKVARGWEKILISAGSACQNFVKLKLTEQILDIIKTPEIHNLKKVSAILEHSTIIKELAPGILADVFALLGKLFTDLIFNHHDSFNKSEEEQLCCTVKLSLQVLQLLPEAKQCIMDMVLKGKCDSLAEQQCFVATMIQGVLTTLIEKTCSRDITLLAGTAAAMIITLFPSPEQVVNHFFSVYDIISQGLPVIKIEWLRFEDFPRKCNPQRDSSIETGSCLPKIALLKSIIMMSSNDIMCCMAVPAWLEPNKDHSEMLLPFLLRLFPAICELCDAGANFKYLSFHLLSLWFKKLSVCLPRLLELNSDLRITNKESLFLQETVKRIWTNWDSPIEGVAEFVTEIFKALLEVWHQEITKVQSDNTGYANELITKVISMPWHSRSRYKPLSLLIPFVDVDVILCQNESLKLELLHCMGTSFLAALATDVYSAFITSIRNNWPPKKQVQIWQEIWMTTVVSGLTNNNCVLRSRVCVYWLPVSLKILPDSGTVLYHHLLQILQNVEDNSAHSMTLFAWVTVSRHIRSLKEMDLDLLPDNLLMEALFSSNEDISSEAIALLCTTQKKAEPVTQKEIKHLCAALPYCLKVDSAAFRQQLTTSLRKLFVRIRDSCLMAVKKKTKTDTLTVSLEFVDWFYQSLMLSLFPGACFQRRRTCLDIIQSWLEIFIFVESDAAKKGKAKGPTDDLIAYAQSNGLWDFFSFKNCTSLLCCITDGADEIQETALHILLKYYPWAQESGLGILLSEFLTHKDHFATHLLSSGIERCRSPRAYETRSGAFLVRLVYEKFVRDEGFCFHVSQQKQLEKAPHDEVISEEASIKFFNDILLRFTESSLQEATRDVLLASRCQPFHGLMQALYLCIHTESSKPDGMPAAKWKKVLLRTVALSTDTISLMLHILAGDQGSSGSCPSFAEMGIALELVLSDSQSEQEATSSLSPDFQLLLAWCWLNLKESCTCLGEVVAASVTQGKPENYMSLGEIEAVGQTFLKVLTQCRHRGAIEGCRNGFMQFCVVLMSSQNADLCKVPAVILNQLLSNLEDDEMTSSVTRRSAGLPIVVQTVLQAEKRCKSDKMLQETVSRLYLIASGAPHEDTSQIHDQSSVHAFNILKTIFSDASLAGDLFSHLGRMVQLVITCFESASWAIRNAATQVASTLVTRMFGQKSKASLSSKMMTLQEFSAHFPELLDFVSQKLDLWLVHRDRITEIQPSLFLVLTLLANLGPSADICLGDSVVTEIQEKVALVTSSPVYFLRELSAVSVVALTALSDTDVYVQEQLANIQEHADQKQCYNRIHGIALCLEKTLASRGVSSKTAERIVQFSLENQWLLQSACPMVSAKCIDVLCLAVKYLTEDSMLREQAVQSLLSILFAPAGHDLQISQSVLIGSMVFCLHDLCCQGHVTLSAQDLYLRCLQSENKDVCRAVLQSIAAHQRQHSDTVNTALEAALWKCLQTERDELCLMEAASLLVTYHLYNHGNKSFIPADLNLHSVKSRFQKMNRIQAALFPVEAIVLAEKMCIAASTDMMSHICDWSQRLKVYSQPFQNEDYRMAAAKGLCLVGLSILKCHTLNEKISLDSAVVGVLDACLALLEDTDTDIRKFATYFVGSLQWDKKAPGITDVSSNMCLKMLMDYIRDEKGDSKAVHEFLLSKLYSPNALSSYIKKHQQQRIQYLFEPEENTFFSEKVVLQLQIFKILMELCSTHSDSCIHYPPSALEILVEELELCVDSLAEMVSGRPIYNLFGETGMVACLVGLVMQAQVLSQCIDYQLSTQSLGSLQLRTRFSTLVDTLLKIPYCHPALRSLLQRVVHAKDIKYSKLQDISIM